MKTLDVVGVVHVLYTGTNGQRTYGITVRAIGPVEEVEKKGACREFDINDNTLLASTTLAQTLGLSDDEYKAIQNEVRALLVADKEKAERARAEKFAALTPEEKRALFAPTALRLATEAFKKSGR